MTDAYVTPADIQELIRVMPEAGNQIKIIIQQRLIDQLEAEVATLRNGTKEAIDANGGETEVSVHDKGSNAGKRGRGSNR